MPLFRNETGNSKQCLSAYSVRVLGELQQGVISGDVSVSWGCPMAWAESHSFAQLCRNTPLTSRQDIFSRLELLLWCLLTPTTTAEQFHCWRGTVSAAA